MHFSTNFQIVSYLSLLRSVHILQLGASVDEMVNMAAIAVIDAQQREKRKKAK